MTRWGAAPGPAPAAGGEEVNGGRIRTVVSGKDHGSTAIAIETKPQIEQRDSTAARAAGASSTDTYQTCDRVEVIAHSPLPDGFKAARLVISPCSRALQPLPPATPDDTHTRMSPDGMVPSPGSGRAQARSLAAFMTFFGITSMVMLALTPPLCRSLVVCGTAAGLSRDDEGAEAALAALNSGNWSGSQYCDDRDLVIETGQHLSASLDSCFLIVRLLSKPFLAAWADRRSRLAVLIVAVLATTVSCAMLAIAAGVAGLGRSGVSPPQAPGTDPHATFATPVSLVFLGVGVRGWRTSQAILLSFVSTLSVERERGNAYTYLLFLQAVLYILGGVVAYQILAQDVRDYTAVYAVLAGASLLPLLPLGTLHRAVARDGATEEGKIVEEKEGESILGSLLNLRLTRGFFSLLTKYSVLRQLCFAGFLLAFGTGGALPTLLPTLSHIPIPTSPRPATQPQPLPHPMPPSYHSYHLYPCHAPQLATPAALPRSIVPPRAACACASWSAGGL